MADTPHPTVQVAKQLSETFGVPTMVVMVYPVGDARQAIVCMEMTASASTSSLKRLTARW